MNFVSFTRSGYERSRATDNRCTTRRTAMKFVCTVFFAAAAYVAAVMYYLASVPTM